MTTGRAVEVLLTILIAVLLVSLISLVGAVFIFFNRRKIEKMIFPLVAFASGSMLGAAFLAMLPESLKGIGSPNLTFAIVLTGIVTFFALERLLYWHHCRDKICRVHPYIYLTIFGDSVHNFVDGMVIAGSFMLGAAPGGINMQLGLLTTVAVIVHEVPQELGDFGILLYGGFKFRKALIYNFASALTAIVGAIVAYFSLSFINFSAPLVAFAAGGFIYVSAVNLMPKLHEEHANKRFLLQLSLFLMGIALIQVLSTIAG
ncbi:MAG: ZIP family metal transporter [Methanobacteriota archaeon]